jgi:hypothetical protein
MNMKFYFGCFGSGRFDIKFGRELYIIVASKILIILVKGKVAVESGIGLLPANFAVAIGVIDVFNILQNRLAIETGTGLSS